jgi:hypothetical protein
MNRKLIAAAAAVGVLVPTAAHAEFLTVARVEGTPIVRRGTRLFFASPGIQLRTGDVIQNSFNEKTFIRLDYGAGIVTAQPLTTVQVQQSSRLNGCSVTAFFYKGRLNLDKKPFTCPQSLLQFLSQQGIYSFRTTKAFCNSNRERSQCVVTDGLVASKSQGETVAVPAGFGNQIYEGQPPTQPVRVERFTRAYIFSKVLPVFQLLFRGTTSPFNSVSLNGKPVNVGKDGEFRATVRRPVISNSAKFEITNPWGDRQVYPLQRSYHPF